jgi:hypothetical protein
MAAGSRVSAELLDFSAAAAAGGASMQSAAANDLTTDTQGRVAVRITAEDVPALIPHLQQSGFEIIASDVPRHFIEAWATPAAISTAESQVAFGLMGVLPIHQPETGEGKVGDQADLILESARVRTSVPNGYDGGGVTVGVLSDSFNRQGGAADDVASGDLPNVKVLKEGPEDSDDEGRAMLQLVHDVAPGAKLAFASAFFGEADFAQQIRNLANPDKGNADVICDDIFYFEEPMFQDGPINQAIDDVVQAGIPYFALAGNLGRQAYESTNISFVNDNIDGNFTTYYDFDPGPGADDRQRITIDNGSTVKLTLQWDDPFFTTNGVKTDLDILLLKGNQVVAESTDNNLQNQTPSEFFSFTNDTATTGTTKFDVVIRGVAGQVPGRIKYVNYGANSSSPITFNEFATSSPTAVPHAGAPLAIGVGAVPYHNQRSPESFTSAGPRTILFNANGSRMLTPDVRAAPVIASIDGVNTTFFGRDFAGDVDKFPNFFGTSAATPNAAAVAALMLDANPNLTPEQIRVRLQNTATDIGDNGFDPLTGSGLINAYDAIFGSATPASLDFKDGFSTGVLNQRWETQTFGDARIRVKDDLPGATGDDQVVLDTFGDGFRDSRNEVTLHVNAAGKSNVSLAFTQREFNDSDDPMPARFTLASNSDGVALSVDGSHWFRIVSLTGAASTNAYQTRTFNLSNIAKENGITLSANTRIRFQQFGNAAITSEGMAIDDVAVTTIVNKRPTIANLGAAVKWQEDGPDTIISSTATVSDADSRNFAGGKLTISFAANATAADRLSVRSQGSGKNQIRVVGSVVSFEGKKIGVLSGGFGAKPLVVGLTANATPRAVQFLLRNVLFHNVSDAPSTLQRTVRVVVTDGDGGTSLAVAKKASVTAFNDSPLLLDVGPPATYRKGSAPVHLFFNASVSDPDSTNFAAGRLSLSLGSTASASDRLFIENQGTAAGLIGAVNGKVTFGGVQIGTYTIGVGSTPLVVTFNTKATPTAVSALLKAITYRNLLANPPTRQRSIDIFLTDGDGGNSGIQIKRVNIVS